MARPDTIYSLSSGQGRAGVAVVRVSGPEADAAVLALAGRLPAPRMATLLPLRTPEAGLIDQALVLRFVEGASFTGEASAEFQVHGGRAVVRALLEALGRLPGLRAAEPGEFTRRALENGCLDLAQVEALADLIEADTEAQRRQALRGLAGELGERVALWRALVLEAKALLAAAIDFSDEGDVGDDPSEPVSAILARLAGELRAALASAARGRIIADGYRVAIVGAPNVGKSTLLNAFAGSEVAIVTEHAGTTRDVLEVRLDIGGHTVVLQDTAGFREASDPVERIGIERGLKAARDADLVLYLDDGTETPLALDIASPSIRVRTKADKTSATSHGADLAISAKTGAGMDSLLKRMADALNAAVVGEPALITRERQRQRIEAALASLGAAQAVASLGVELVDEELRRVDAELAELIGSIHVEQVLAQVFSRFCIGK